jgi:hypothetical protein
MRLSCRALLVVGWLNLLELGWRIAVAVFLGTEGAPLPFLVRRAFYFSALPALLAALFSLACSGTLEVWPQALVVVLAGRRAEIARSSLRDLEVLRAPWVRLRLASGAAFPLDLAPRNAPAFGAALGFFVPRPAPRFLLLRFAVVPAILVLLLFNRHQHFAFGGFLGEWRLVSPSRWLRTVVGVSLAVYIYLLAFAAWLRLAVEAVALLLPRKPLEIGAAIAYVVGIAALLAARLS